MVHRTIEIGGRRLGIRTTSRAFGAWIDETFPEHLVGGEPEMYDYSVVVDGGDGAESDRRGTRFHILYYGVGAVIRTMHLPELGRSLVAELEGWALKERTDRIFVHAAAVAMDGISILVPAWLVAYLGDLGRRIERAQLRLPIARWSAVDPESGSLVPPPPIVDVPKRAFDDLERLQVPNGRGPTRVEDDAERRVDAVLTYDPALDTIAPGPRGIALHRIVSQTANLGALGGDALAGLGELVRGARSYETGLGRKAQMLEALLAVVGHERAHREASS